MNLKYAIAVAALAIGAAGNADASLTYVGLTTFGGTGLGAVNTILTLTSPGSTSTEAGCVAYGGVIGANCLGAGSPGGNELTGQSQTQTRTIGQSGATTAAEFALVLNAQEPAGDSITVNSLSVRFYSPSGLELFTASLPASVAIPATLAGTGNSGFTFALDQTQAAQATQAGAFSNVNNVIGVSTSLSSATGGPETFFVARIPGRSFPGGDPAPIPEPSTYLSLGGGLIALGCLRRRMARRTE